MPGIVAIPCRVSKICPAIRSLNNFEFREIPLTVKVRFGALTNTQREIPALKDVHVVIVIPFAAEMDGDQAVFVGHGELAIDVINLILCWPSPSLIVTEWTAPAGTFLSVSVCGSALSGI